MVTKFDPIRNTSVECHRGFEMFHYCMIGSEIS